MAGEYAVTVLLCSALTLGASGFLFGEGIRCYQCPLSHHPSACTLSVSCVPDQQCYTERYVTPLKTSAYRQGCISTQICKGHIQPRSDDHCFRCCSGKMCNNNQCSKETCPRGYYGPQCADVCGHCINGEQCEKAAGLCPHGCEDGYLSPYCHAACQKPFYGPECRYTCGHCAGSDFCEFRWGMCKNGCEAGFIPPFCNPNLNAIGGNDCDELRLKTDYRLNGLYLLTSAVETWCDMRTEDRGWIVFQRRTSAAVTFSRTWIEYKTGFGKQSSDFWWGNDNLASFTSHGQYVLRIDMEDATGIRTYAEYQNFFVDGENAKYRLHLGTYSGNATDGLSYVNEQMFSTEDQDNDSSITRHCAAVFPAGWWFNNCFRSNLNGIYMTPGIVFAQGIIWSSDVEDTPSLKWTEMKFRRM